MLSSSAIIVCDSTLRDGSHAYKHQISLEQATAYAAAADSAGYSYLEVGHGNGLGASSLQVGESLVSDSDMLSAVRQKLQKIKLSVHVIPGVATIRKDLEKAIAIGVDLFRVGCHCTEADVSQRHIGHLRNAGREAWGVLMMSHMASAEVLLGEAKKMESYGAQAIMLMDSAGRYFPSDVTEKIGLLTANLSIPVGFHAHQNLGLAIANSLAALEAGARILDGTARGFGAGAGNAPLEILAAVLQLQGHPSTVDLYKSLDASEVAAKLFAGFLPESNAITIVSGLSGVFSGFSKPVQRAAGNLGIDPRDILIALGNRKVVAGQEDLIFEVASEIAVSQASR